MEFYFILGIVVYGCFFMIVEAQTLTRKGSIGHLMMEHAIFEDTLNWFEARQRCINEGYDNLDDAAYTNIRYDGIGQKLDEEGQPFDRMWVYFHRISASFPDWYETGCIVTDRVGTEVRLRNMHLCVQVHYVGNGVFDHHDCKCNTNAEFICTKYIGLANFTIYDKSEIAGIPHGCTWTVKNQSTSEICRIDCDFNLYCIAYMFDDISHQCVLIILEVGKAWADVEVVDTNNSTTVGVRVGMIVTFHPSTSVSLSVPSISPCELPSTLSTSPTTPILVAQPKTSTVTSTPTSLTINEPIFSNLTTNFAQTINVTGFLDQHSSTRYNVVLQEATWYEAELMCRQDYVGSLGTVYPSWSCRDSIVNSILNESHAYPNVSLWVKFFRNSSTSTDWYTTNYGHTRCNPVSESIVDDGGQCAYAVFREYGDSPELHSTNCSTALPFVCMKNYGANTTNFTSFPGYDVTSGFLPDSTVFLSKDYSSVESCVYDCKDRCSCIGVSYYHNISDGCKMVIALYGRQYLDYQLSVSYQNVTHFVKNGVKGSVYNADSVNIPDNVPETLPACLATSTTSTYAHSTKSASTTTNSPSSISNNARICQCQAGSPPCDVSRKHIASTLEETVAKIAKKLLVKKTATSAHKRRLVSVTDDRGSSKTIGAMAIAILSMFMAFIVVPDAISLVAGVKSMLGSTTV